MTGVAVLRSRSEEGVVTGDAAKQGPTEKGKQP